jgi:hypothetical protein
MKIVLTGGPSAGKTTIAEALIRAYWDRAALVPESASILYRGGFPRENFAEAVVCQQRAIYRVQREIENVARLKAPSRILICDRGTLDGLAFWPLNDDDFFGNMETTKEAELARYDWVIHLETAAENAYRPSPIRRESYVEARAIDQKLQEVWRSHPRWAMVPNHLDFSMKITRAMLAVSMIMGGEPEEKIRALLSSK